MENSTELEPSELGTKEYWLSVYEREKKNYDQYGDPGEIWFGEESGHRILKWLEKTMIPKDKSVVDIGCGNGMMLLEMRNEGFLNLTGIDYCANAIELARSIVSSQSIDDINFFVLDIVNDAFDKTFDIALDKGTYDAVSLDPDNASEKRIKYIKNVSKLLNSEGLLIITSCNWTEDEIGDQFEKEFEYVESIPTPTFKFGGKVGSVVSSLVLKKRSTS